MLSTHLDVAVGIATQSDQSLRGGVLASDDSLGETALGKGENAGVVNSTD